MEEFTPTLPSKWKIYPPGPIIIADAEWDEDLFGASWGKLAIWLDGGKGLSIFQCCLVIICEEINENGNLAHDHERVMRDFVDTPDQVLEWIRRALLVADKLHEEMEKDDDRRPEEG